MWLLRAAKSDSLFAALSKYLTIVLDLCTAQVAYASEDKKSAPQGLKPGVHVPWTSTVRGIASDIQKFALFSATGTLVRGCSSSEQIAAVGATPVAKPALGTDVSMKAALLGSVPTMGAYVIVLCHKQTPFFCRGSIPARASPAGKWRQARPKASGRDPEKSFLLVTRCICKQSLEQILSLALHWQLLDFTDP